LHHVTGFGARTAGSNLIFGGIFLMIALLFGEQLLPVINLLPMSVLRVLLISAGTQLALTILDMQTRKEFYIVILIVGIALASDLAAGFFDRHSGCGDRAMGEAFSLMGNQYSISMIK